MHGFTHAHVCARTDLFTRLLKGQRVKDTEKCIRKEQCSFKCIFRSDFTDHLISVSVDSENSVQPVQIIWSLIHPSFFPPSELTSVQLPLCFSIFSTPSSFGISLQSSSPTLLLSLGRVSTRVIYCLALTLRTCTMNPVLPVTQIHVHRHYYYSLTQP